MPKIIFIYRADYYESFVANNTSYLTRFNDTNQIFYLEKSTNFRTYSDSQLGETYYSISGTTVSWYNKGNRFQQMNGSYTYAYIAIGK